MVDLLLLHGAFRGGWSWAPVAARLRARGHHVLAPDLPGAGERWRPGHAPVGLPEVVDDLVSCFEGRDLRDVVLVGHSQGGFVATALTQHVAPRLRGLLLLDAPVPSHGDRAVDLAPPGAPSMPDPPRDLWLPPSPLDPAEVGPVRAARWTSRLTPLSVAIALDAVELDDPVALELPRRVAFCRDTPAGYPCWHTRDAMDRAGEPYELLAAPHDAPLVAPAEVADWLLTQVGTLYP